MLNQKGGVGKTTTVANLGAAIAVRGCATCLVDLDPQAHMTLHFNVEPGSTPTSVYDVLSGDAELAPTCMGVSEQLWIVPSVIDLAGAEVELAATVGREQILRDALHAQPLPAELILIDCPPSLGLLTLNALAAADEVLIPLQPHFLALQGVGKLLETVALVRRRINPRLRVAGVILCLYETGTRLAAEVVEDLRGFLDAARGTDCPWGETRIYEALIRRNVKLAECPSHGKTIFEYDALSRGATDYNALADEFVCCYPALFPPEAVVAAEQAAARAREEARWREADDEADDEALEAPVEPLPRPEAAPIVRPADLIPPMPPPFPSREPAAEAPPEQADRAGDTARGPLIPPPPAAEPAPTQAAEPPEQQPTRAPEPVGEEAAGGRALVFAAAHVAAIVRPRDLVPPKIHVPPVGERLPRPPAPAVEDPAREAAAQSAEEAVPARGAAEAPPEAPPRESLGEYAPEAPEAAEGPGTPAPAVESCIEASSDAPFGAPAAGNEPAR